MDCPDRWYELEYSMVHPPDQYSCQQEASLYAASKRGRAYLELTNQEIVMGGLIGDERVLEQKRFKQCMENKGYQLK